MSYVTVYCANVVVSVSWLQVVPLNTAVSTSALPEVVTPCFVPAPESACDAAAVALASPPTVVLKEPAESVIVYVLFCFALFQISLQYHSGFDLRIGYLLNVIFIVAYIICFYALSQNHRKNLKKTISE